ncbi:uncharacterized protein LODBEIA_P38260 [Lodderomyces beijingensis]|uniref:DNA repair and recombination protein RDH54 n=1 Tax=Lodderomyces beijingensis TaxID=1775926 RepID=A0ABP0ZTL0_9ASCO
MYSRPNAAFKPPRPINRNGANSGSSPSSKGESPPKPRPNNLKRAPAADASRARDDYSKKLCTSNSTTARAGSHPADGKYIVQWRRKTNKKNKSWDGDGRASIKFNDPSCEILLKNSDGKVLSRKNFNQAPDLSDVIPIGMFEIFLDEKIVDKDHSQPEHPDFTHDSGEEFEEETQKVPTTSFKKVVPKDHEDIPQKRKPFYKQKEGVIILPPPPSEPDHVEVSVDPLLSSKLRPHQIEGVSFMYECVMGFRDFKGHGCLLADEMGLGKTLMTITTIWTLLKQNPFPEQKKPVVNKVLIVCPVTLIANWKQEFKKWLGPNKLNILTLNNPMCDDKRDIVNFGKLNVYQVLIINYEKLLTHSEELSTVNFDLLVCDEGHRLKNSANKVLMALKSLSVPKKIVLTGTPIQNYLEEFHTLISFINPSVLPDVKTFQKKFINPITQARDVNCFNEEIKKRGEELSKQLIQMTHKFILRRTQSILENYLTLKTDVLLFVPPTQLQLDLFQQIKKSEKFHQLDSGSVSLALINVFKKICNSPSLLSSDEFYHKITDSSLKLSTSSGKINALIPLLLEMVAQREKIVLISNYTKTLDMLEVVLRKLHLSHTRLDGSTPKNTRNKLVTEFNKSQHINVFLLSSKSGGMGINLVGASRLILFDNDWNPSTDLQSMSRIHRDGQTKPCFIYRLFTAGCIDEKIFQRQLMKNKLSSKFLDNDQSSKTDVFEQEDLKNLFDVDSSTKSNTHDLLECLCGGDGSLLTQKETGIENDDKNDKDDKDDKDDDDDDGDDVQVKSTQSWMSAAALQKHIEEVGENDKKAVKDALNDYHHYDPAIVTDLDFDPVLQKIAQHKSFEIKFPISFIMKKSSAKEI